MDSKPKAQAEEAMDQARKGQSTAANTDEFKRSNGNREQGDTSDAGSAESRGPDLDKAEKRQPPDATR